MQPGPGMVLAHVSAGQRAFSVSFGRSRQSIARCEGACDFWAWPGKYRVTLAHEEGPHRDVRVALNIRGQGNYVYVPANGNAQNTGLFLGVAGPTLGAVGLVLTAVGLLKGRCDDVRAGEHCDDKPAVLFVGLGTLAVGAGLTAVGWPLYAHNRAHFEPSDAPPAKPSARLGIIRMPRGGLGFGAAFVF